MAKSETTKQVDARTNMKVPRVEMEVKTEADYLALREAFAAIPPTPVLVNVNDIESVELPNRKYEWFLRSEQSAGMIAIHRLTLYPGFKAKEHNHVKEGEFFYVLEGEVDFTIGNKRMIGGPGTFGYAPPMGTHAFQPVGDKPAVLLHWNTPGGHEKMPESMAKLNKRGDATPEERQTLHRVHEYIFHDD